ncbi:MAG TPA: aldolase/citrate lyase family protein [Bryobacteraceae bacterium]|jgi:2-keto-3-deoxy-L-rhamnonate aldolase RhmA|nr:aldolase/citrate lyase family protein [Bryobacteraceae bacterium]
MRVNHVKSALKQGKLQLGCGFGQIRSVEAVKILAAAGFHWTFIDAEHGNFGIETLFDLCHASGLAGLSPIVRVADMQYALIARALDCGADGVIFPRVESPELLERAVSWTKFPPMGVRGMGLGAQHFEYERVTVPRMIEHSNTNTMVVLQIETQRAVEARDELLSVPGIDAVMCGPVDLSISLGVPGDFQHPRMVDAMEKIRDSCLQHGVAPGTQTRTMALAKFWKERGMIFLGNGNETSFLLDKATEVVDALK